MASAALSAPNSHGVVSRDAGLALAPMSRGWPLAGAVSGRLVLRARRCASATTPRRWAACSAAWRGWVCYSRWRRTAPLPLRSRRQGD